MTIPNHLMMTLRRVAKDRNLEIGTVNEEMRQNLIDLGMMEPPLVAVQEGYAYLTPAGETAACEKCGGTGWREPIGPKSDGSYITSRPCSCRR